MNPLLLISLLPSSGASNPTTNAHIPCPNPDDGATPPLPPIPASIPTGVAPAVANRLSIPSGRSLSTRQAV